MIDCLIGMGSNIGDRQATLESAAKKLREAPEISNWRISRWLETAPVGGPAHQQPFLNGAARFQTDLTAPAVLERLLDVERQLGREREVRWAPRTLDLDLLLYGDQIVRLPNLQIPHPWMSLRRFVIEPAAEIADDWKHPEIGWTMAELLQNLSARPLRVLVTGLAQAARPELLKKIAADFEGQLRTLAGVKSPQPAENSGPQIDWLPFPAEASQEAPTPDSQFSLRRNLTLILLAETSNLPESEAAAQQRMVEWATVSGQGPFLKLDIADPARLEHDITAAIAGLK